MTTPTPISDELRRVVGCEAHASAPARRGKVGGEWDAWYALPIRTRRRLIGGGYARSGEMPPDVLADVIIRQGVADDYNTALAWYYRTAIAALNERQRAARADYRAKAAADAGQPSYFHLRNELAKLHGHESFWHQRKARRVTNGQLPIEPRVKPERWVPIFTIEQRREIRRRRWNRSINPPPPTTGDPPT